MGLFIIIAVAVILTIVRESPSLEVLWEAVVLNPEPDFREEFIRKIAADIEVKPRATVQYVPEGNLSMLEERGYTRDADTLMIVHLKPESRVSEWMILVFPEAFNSKFVRTWRDFKSLLLRNYEIATSLQTQNVGGVPFSSFLTKHGEPNLELFKRVAELHALRREFGSSEILSDEYKRTRGNGYFSDYVGLWEYGKDMDPGFISDIRVKYFPPFLPKPTRTKTVSITDPRTGKTYVLTEEEVEKISRQP